MKQYAKSPIEPGPSNHYLIKQENGVARVHKLYETLKDAVHQCLSSVKACDSIELSWFVLSSEKLLKTGQIVETISNK